MVHLSIPDVIIIFAYFGGVLWVGFRAASRTKKTEEDFLLAGRSLTLPIFVATLVSTWYGGVLGVGEFTYRYGISNWVTQGLPYYVFAAVFAAILAKKIRATNLYSIPDKLEAAYDRKTALLGSLLTFILMTPAPYILMLGVFLQILFGWGLVPSLLVSAVVAASYLYWGGFRSDVHTDILEFILMFAGFIVILPYCVERYGGFGFLQANLPSLHLSFLGGNSVQYVIVWFFIALWTLVDPSFHQRCYAARDGNVAQKGILISIGFWFFFDFVTTAAGLYARAALPHLAEPMEAYPMLAEALLPPVAKGIFYVGMLATIMSTLNTLVFVSAQTIGRDFILRARGSRVLGAREEGSPVVARYTQFGFILTLVLSLVLAYAIPSVINLWYTVGTVVIPGLLVPLMASYFDRLKIPTRFAFCAMLFGWLTSLAWLLAGHLNGRSGEYPLGVEPMYPGLGLSLVVWGAGRIWLKWGPRGGENEG